MPRLLATATAVLWVAGYRWLAVAAAVLLLTVYPLSCWLWPLRPCRVCSGRGAHFREDGRVFRLCWWCKGAKGRLRYGRRAWNSWRHRAG